MQFTLMIDQSKSVEWGLTPQESILFSFIHQVPTWAKPINKDGQVFYAISKLKIVEELPILTDKPDTTYRILKSLHSKGVISLSSTSRITLIQVTDKGKAWNREATSSGRKEIRSRSENLPMQVGESSDKSGNQSGNQSYTPTVPASGDDTGGKKQSEKEKAQTVLDLFNEVCGHVLPKSIALNAKRQRQIQSVCKLKLADGASPFADYNPDAWRAYFHMILENPWNTGENPSGWVATIDYATRPDTVIKTLEKKYA